MTRLLSLIFCLLLISNTNICDAAKRPNVIVILSDDMGYSDLGCYGGEIRTPNLDALAAKGVRFTQFYNTGRCCPTRASLLSGLYPHQAGIGHMTTDNGWEGYTGELNKHCVTMAEVMKSAGYFTIGLGKWHVVAQRNVNPDGDKSNWPLQRGFHKFYGTITGAGSFYDPGTLTRDNTMISPFADAEYKPEKYFYTHALRDHAIRYIRDHHQNSDKTRPFFMYLAFTNAHWPMHALDEDIAKYKGHFDGGYDVLRKARYERLQKLGLTDPAWGLSPTAGDWSKVEHREWQLRCMEVYGAMISCMDESIGNIVQELKNNGEFDNTLICFMQDNGGCQETVGRAMNETVRQSEPRLPTIAQDAIRLDVIPKQTRDGHPVLQGPLNMPGPHDTYIAYGLEWANVSNTPFREYKHFVHEGGISTPLIMSWPSKMNPDQQGKLITTPGHLIDIMATCVDAGEAVYPQEINGESIRPKEGVSLIPALTGSTINRQNPLFWEHEGNRAVRDGDWKLVAKEDKPWELYNMKQDRSELHDLAQQMPEKVTELAAKWDAYAERAQVLPLGGWKNKNPEKFPNQQKNNPNQNKPKANAQKK